MNTWDIVIREIKARNEFGFNKYGKYLSKETDEDMLKHAYEEALDLTVYLRTLLLQRDGV